MPKSSILIYLFTLWVIGLFLVNLNLIPRIKFANLLFESQSFIKKFELALDAFLPIVQPNSWMESVDQSSIDRKKNAIHSENHNRNICNYRTHWMLILDMIARAISLSFILCITDFRSTSRTICDCPIPAFVHCSP